MFKKKKFPKYEWYNVILDDKGNESNPKKAFGGQTEKMFVRMDSDFLTDFFEEVSQGNTSYVTYIDDIIPEYLTTKKPPIKAVSLMMKLYDSNCKYGYMEDMGSRVANLLGLPVVYNKTFKDGGIHYGLSIDFMKHDKSLRYGTLEGDYFTAPHDTHKGLDLEGWMNFFENKVLVDAHTKRPLHDPDRLAIFRGFLPSYFFRKYIIEDPDFDVRNMSIIYNSDTEKYSFGPNYDMERAFVEDRQDYLYDHCLQRDLQLAYEMFPDIMRPFMARLKAVHEKHMITPKLLGNIKAPVFRGKIITRLNKNIDAIYKANMIVEERMRGEM